MLTKMYSIRDQKAEVYNTPFFSRTHGDAERTLVRLANDPQSMIAQFPLDYDLYYLGDYDTDTGKLTPVSAPQHIAQAIHVVKKAQPTLEQVKEAQQQ